MRRQDERVVAHENRPEPGSRFDQAVPGMLANRRVQGEDSEVQREIELHPAEVDENRSVACVPVGDAQPPCRRRVLLDDGGDARTPSPPGSSWVREGFCRDGALAVKRMGSNVAWTPPPETERSS